MGNFSFSHHSLEVEPPRHQVVGHREYQLVFGGSHKSRRGDPDLSFGSNHSQWQRRAQTAEPRAQLQMKHRPTPLSNQ